MKRTIAICLCFAATLGMSPAHAETYATYMTGGAYVALPAKERSAYVLGVADMMSRMCELVDAGSVEFCGRVQRCTGAMTPVQLLNFVDAYMKDPKYREYGMASNYRAAMNANCPQ